MIQLRWLVLGLIALPFLEFATFFFVAGQIGFLGALFGVVLTSFLGIMLLKGGAKLLLAQVMRSGGVVLMSGEAARSGMLTAFAGLLLAIPGFVTDVIAVILLVPALRGLLSRGGLTTTGQRPPPPGVVDLEPADWREERRPPGADPRLGPPGKS
ncbi:MAG: FxsA family protein [Phreatobacter sp.]|uniref:FxsA family protein n=1 Tax=Phreatobacter sp. TaxID=1966341 RepID=UPI002733A17B|nr:FxsA family protein [Phreatobacter sp.]MDP2803554.1 FxsA family protein [Phreatobacter sp.]